MGNLHTYIRTLVWLELWTCNILPCSLMCTCVDVPLSGHILTYVQLFYLCLMHGHHTSELAL